MCIEIRTFTHQKPPHQIIYKPYKQKNLLLEIHPENPSPRKIEQVIKVLEKGGVIIYPTDTVYAFGCDIQNQKAIKQICRLRNLDPKKANLTFICKDISQLASYATQLDNDVFKTLRRNTPGPFTFILKANKEVPRIFSNRKKTVGVRIPENKIAVAIIEALDRPILSISLKNDDEILEYFTNPSEIYDDYAKQVDMIIDGGTGKNQPSTVVDATSREVEIIRNGIGELV